ncbi:hypothetical protein HF086_006753 [Spodoptera exigua]|uniref:Uncharacterized protein n=1 Tax=Spodoptera exigua TaxID=7107 RepID=A0A922SBB9_SPOEX|nr:hypothetical protein HF086_006753 [Spodoptera exigua]
MDLRRRLARKRMRTLTNEEKEKLRRLAEEYPVFKLPKLKPDMKDPRRGAWKKIAKTFNFISKALCQRNLPDLRRALIDMDVLPDNSNDSDSVDGTTRKSRRKPDVYKIISVFFYFKPRALVYEIKNLLHDDGDYLVDGTPTEVFDIDLYSDDEARLHGEAETLLQEDTKARLLTEMERIQNTLAAMQLNESDYETVSDSEINGESKKQE